MQQYGKNLEKGLLNDGTIWLWDDRYASITCFFSDTLCHQGGNFLSGFVVRVPTCD